MSTFSQRMFFLLLTLSALVINGCGGDGGSASALIDTTSVQKGSVVQGPVSGATVFADNVAAGARFVLDAAEISAQTGSDGSFFLPSFPAYNFILVSSGGKDTITGQDALLLLAPAGSANITPLTTLVTLDTTKTLQAKLEALNGNRKFDVNVSTSASPAILMLIKSAETAVQSVSDAVKQAGTPAGSTVSQVTQVQLNYIQAQTWREIALSLAAASATSLATPAGLNAALTTALEKAIAAIILPAAANINVATFTASAGTIAATSVDAALKALGQTVTYTSTTALGTTDVRTEGSLSSPATVFTDALNTLKTAFTVVIIAQTPNTYSPPPIQVVTTTSEAIIQIITGASGGTGGIGLTF